MPSSFDPRTGTYTLDGATYTTVDVTRMLEAYIARQEQAFQAAVDRYLRGEMSRSELESTMRTTIKDTHIVEYVLAHGGRTSMSLADWGRLGQIIRGQYSYLNGFLDALNSMSAAQALARAALYAHSARSSYWRGLAQVNSISLPAYPGDGTTRCKMNCRCRWHLEYSATEIRAYWQLGAAEHCPDCVARAAEWNPIVVLSQESVRV